MLAGSVDAGKPSRHTNGYATPSTRRTPPNQNQRPRPRTGACSPAADPAGNDLHNLPESSTSFVGRRRVLTELSAGLGRTRLLTLTGVGGVGKSRLALELARLAGASGDFPDGIWLVELAGLQDPEVVTSTVASALASRYEAETRNVSPGGAACLSRPAVDHGQLRTPARRMLRPH